ncbi:hypothetical protein COU78_02695 [Candidatus Peregrinibacteria bacterium CG10_big_fil_rev_8_21_14_0_10_49_24]|nr:MAG: hypothetical protein COV83_02675 [Candidatus Peregrinibacteria bacterium CG11_big_fil_rev_8_21_14_0_20_49_14]PIR51045.1 MAG: hypothetical protein COU78_02695 [Candidatus Peregrinibacteria bacterium CG10_big_fil_rev_8_21_14_0_10_49_24]PJA67598.1 MAG: hypothetical protein CO157_04175 [Candidatus Peregrinibacteria bacterium CG_4_9_14_3_um_filter_49_12]
MVVNRKKEQVKSLSAQDGQYLFNVQPPEGAVTTLRFYEGGVLVNTTQGTQVSFTFSGNGTLRAEVLYRYEGVVAVESTPAGASFELRGPNGVRYTGVTPASFNGMPPLYYTASYSSLPGCQQPKPQSRVLRPNASLIFEADFICENEKVTVKNTPPPADKVPTNNVSTPAMQRMLDEHTRSNVSLFHSLNQNESVPGSTVYVTLGIRNIGKTTLKNVTLTEQFDAEKLSPIGVLPQGGKIIGSVMIWEIPSIFAGQSFSVTFPVKISSDILQGEKVTLSARVSGDSVYAPQGELLSKMIDVGVVAMPATGWKADVLFALLSAGALGALTLTSNPIIRRKSAVVQTASKQ